MQTVLDERLTMAIIVDNEEEIKKEMERVMNMALACVEQERDRNPSMSKLVEMLMVEEALDY